VVVNQILGAALAAIGDLPLAASVAARAAECRAHFPEVSTLHSVETAMERLVLGRNTERYREALVLARMILGQYAPQLRAGAVAVFGLLFDMNSLWERYVAALFRRADVPGLTVRTQSSVRFWKSDGESTRTIRPDIVVRAGPATVLVVDTKWKVSNDGSPSDDDLKQMFAYNELLDAPHALLVYPSDGAKVVSKSGAFSDRKHRCGTLHLGLFDACGWSASAMQAEVRALLAGHARLGSSVTVPEREPGRSQLRARVRA
jgi:5-methylcytosine-specific restriction enzyme subunit McrC